MLDNTINKLNEHPPLKPKAEGTPSAPFVDVEGEDGIKEPNWNYISVIRREGKPDLALIMKGNNIAVKQVELNKLSEMNGGSLPDPMIK